MNIAPGKYTARAVEAVMGYTQSGTEQICICFEFTDEVNHGHRANWYGVFSEKNGRKVLEQMSYCGWRGDWDTLAGLYDQEVSITVEFDKAADGTVKKDRNDVPYTRIAWVNPIGGASLKTKMDPGQVKSFAARMKGITAEVLGGAPARTTQPAQRAPAASTGPRPTNGQRAPQGAAQWDGTGANPEADDIPFLFGGWR